MRTGTRLATLALLLALGTLGGCARQDLYTQLAERQANEMVAALRTAGIAAEKRALDGQRFAVSVAADSFAPAVEVLRIGGHPRQDHDTLGQVFKKEGFVSSPLEERARLAHALSQEIAGTVGSIDGVVLARVHLSVPERDPLAERAPASSASVFIKHRPGLDLSGQVGQIKALVVNSLPGLPYDKVTVVLFPAEPLPAPPPPGLLDRLPHGLLWAAALGLAALAGGGALLWWQRHSPRRAEASTLLPTRGPASTVPPTAT